MKRVLLIKIQLVIVLLKMKGDIFLINEALREPLMHIANKLLGRQCPNFEQLTPPEQELWSLLTVIFMKFSQDKKTQCQNLKTF
jgi:hypothetical protein